MSRRLERMAEARQSMNEVEASEIQEMAFYPRVFCQIGFPVDAPKIVNEYTRSSGPHHLSIMAPSVVGVPWGIYPRGIMAWIVSNVVKRKKEGRASQTVNLGNDLMSFMANVTGNEGGFSGGKTGNIRPFKRQLASLLASRVMYWYDDKVGQQWKSMEVTSAGSLLWAPQMIDSPGLFQSTIVLGEAFWQDILENAIPIDNRALRGLWPSCMAVDSYVWLTYRSHTRNGRRSQHISWPMLKLQFGSSVREMKHFRQKFLQTLKRVEQAYTHMEWKEESSGGKQGITFRWNRPAIASRNQLALPAVARTIDVRHPDASLGAGVRPDGYYSGER